MEAVAAAPVAAAITVLRRTMQVARVAPADLHAVLLVGGSSRMPLVASMVAEAMGGRVPIESLDDHAVARGAAHLTREAWWRRTRTRGLLAHGWLTGPCTGVTPAACVGAGGVGVRSCCQSSDFFLLTAVPSPSAGWSWPACWTGSDF